MLQQENSPLQQRRHVHDKLCAYHAAAAGRETPLSSSALQRATGDSPLYTWVSLHKFLARLPPPSLTSTPFPPQRESECTKSLGIRQVRGGKAVTNFFDSYSLVILRTCTGFFGVCKLQKASDKKIMGRKFESRRKEVLPRGKFESGLFRALPFAA